jgi:hypothetical protein
MLKILSMNVRIVAREALAVLFASNIKSPPMGIQSISIIEPFSADNTLDAILINRKAHVTGIRVNL